MKQLTENNIQFVKKISTNPWQKGDLI